MLLYNSFCYRVVAFGRMCLKGLFGASGVSWESSPISADGLQVASLSQGSFLPSVPVNRNKLGLGSCKSPTEAACPY